MKYAITPRGVGNVPGARCIKDGEPLREGETFTVFADKFDANKVLAEDGLSLRDKTQEEYSDELAKELDAPIKSTLEAIDMRTIRSLREWLASQPDAPMPVLQLDNEARSWRTLLRRKGET